MNAPLATDPEAALAFLDLLHPGGPWILTAITPDGPATTETFSRADTVAKWILRENAARNIYIMVAEASGPLRKKATKADVARTYHLWADLDGGDDLRERLNGQVPPPTAIVASGGGLNLYWALAEPIADRLDIEAHTRWLAERLGADHCWNCDRILRLPGTINWPNKKKLSKGREPVLAQCTEFHPDRVYDFDDFGRIEASVDGTEAKEGRPGIDDDTPLLTLDDLPAEVREKLPGWARRLIREGPGAEEYRDDRSKAIWAVVCALVRADASDDQIAGILLNPDLPIHAHVADQKGHGPRAYVARQIERAREHVAKEPGKGKPGEDGKPLPFKMLDELKLSTAPFWLIEGYLVRSPMMMIYGPAGSGKTYLGVSVAIGMLLSQWFGRAAEPGAVLICAFERHDDSEDRLAALRDRHGMAGKGLPLALVDMTGQCLDADAEAKIIATAKAIVEKSAQPMRAILIDTVAAACGGREQTPGLQGELRDAGNRIAAATGALVCWVQHEGKTSHNGPIGYLDLANSCSTWWRVEEREDGSRVVHVDKANRGPVHVPLFAFRLVPFVAGQDDKRSDIVLCDVEEVALEGALASEPRQPFGRPKSDKPAAGQGSLQKIMLAELHKLLRRHPDGVEKDLLKSAFVMKADERHKAKGGPPLTPKDLTRKFNQTLHSMLHPATGDPLIEQNEDGTFAMGETP